LTLQPESLVGTTIGPYTATALLGAGGMAWVVVATRSTGGGAEGQDGREEVALKLLKPKYAGDAQFTARFLNEAGIARELRHPNIIRILDVGQAGEAGVALKPGHAIAHDADAPFQRGPLALAERGRDPNNSRRLANELALVVRGRRLEEGFELARERGGGLAPSHDVNEPVREPQLIVSGQRDLILDRICNSAEQICVGNDRPQRRWQLRNGQREGARDAW